jgi:hypothetical protein
MTQKAEDYLWFKKLYDEFAPIRKEAKNILEKK